MDGRGVSGKADRMDKRGGSGKADIERLLAEGNVVQLKPQGWSMYPLIVPGRDEVRIAPTDARRLRRGEVVLYRRTWTPEWNGRIATGTPQGQILVLHRIWKRRGDQFYMVGDNQKLVEGPLELFQMKGVMVGFVRNGHYHSVNNAVYRLYAWLWLWMRPLRPVLSRAAAALKRLISHSRPDKRLSKD